MFIIISLVALITGAMMLLLSTRLVFWFTLAEHHCRSDENCIELLDAIRTVNSQ